MAHDAAILELLREYAGDIATGERKMFGAHALMLNGNMFLAAYGGDWHARVGPDGMAAAEALGAVPFAPKGGRGMKGIAAADMAMLEDEDIREKIIALAVSFVETLPPK
ncbi:MAG: TfoX/Sxy family protein [Pseudomonadota bacterium]